MFVSGSALTIFGRSTILWHMPWPEQSPGQSMISQARPARWLMHLHTPDSRSQLPAFEHSTMECPFWLLFGTSATAGPSGHVPGVARGGGLSRCGEHGGRQGAQSKLTQCAVVGWLHRIRRRTPRFKTLADGPRGAATRSNARPMPVAIVLLFASVLPYGSAIRHVQGRCEE